MSISRGVLREELKSTLYFIAKNPNDETFDLGFGGKLNNVFLTGILEHFIRLHFKGRAKCLGQYLDGGVTEVAKHYDLGDDEEFAWMLSSTCEKYYRHLFTRNCTEEFLEYMDVDDPVKSREEILRFFDENLPIKNPYGEEALHMTWMMKDISRPSNDRRFTERFVEYFMLNIKYFRVPYYFMLLGYEEVKLREALRDLIREGKLEPGVVVENDYFRKTIRFIERRFLSNGIHPHRQGEKQESGQNNKGNQKKCYSCGERGHIARHCN